MAKNYTFIISVLFITLFSTSLYAQSNIKLSNKAELEIKAYPNPVKSGDYITLEFQNFDSNKAISISIINVIGKQLLLSSVDTASLKLQMLKNKYPAGIYILKAKQDNKIRTLRLNIVR